MRAKMGRRRIIVMRTSRVLVVVAAFLATLLGPSNNAHAAPNVSWQVLPGRATDVGVGSTGAVWTIGAQPVPGGYTIQQWTGAGWRTEPGGAVRIAVGPDGEPWIVNWNGKIFHRVNGSWLLMPGSATDIAAGGNGVWITGTDSVPGGYNVYQWTGVGWSRGNGGAVRVAVDSTGRPWLVNSSGRVFRRDGGGWTALPGNGRDVGAGGGLLWIIGTESVPGGYTVRLFDGVDWTTIPGGATTISAGPGGHPWVVNAFGEVFRGQVSGVDIRGCDVEDLAVPEAAFSVTTKTILPGETLRVTPGIATIWAGVILTGENGPEGWSNAAPAGFPLPGARVFSLLASVPARPGWLYVGATEFVWTNATGANQVLRFRVNDDVPGNGSGAFQVSVAHPCRIL